MSESWGGILNPEWRFTAAIERPDGYHVQVILTVPDYKDVVEQSEVAQMAAANALAVHTRIQNKDRARAARDAF